MVSIVMTYSKHQNTSTQVHFTAIPNSHETTYLQINVTSKVTPNVLYLKLFIHFPFSIVNAIYEQT